MGEYIGVFMMIDIQTLRTQLQAVGVEDSQYTDEQLQAIIENARSVLGDCVEERTHEDYLRHFSNDVYTTNYYPINVDDVEVTCDDKAVQVDKITKEGVIYFTNTERGSLRVVYVQAIDTSIVDNVVSQLVVYMIQQKQAGNIEGISSINEGDISISYDTNSTLRSDALVQKLIDDLRNSYKARVRLL